MELFGLLLEVLFLLFGIGMYLYARGLLHSKDPAMQQKAEAFRKTNGWWIRLAALALIAIMAVNIFLHLQSFFS